MLQPNVLSYAGEAVAPALADRSDDELMVLAGTHGERAFELLVERHMRALLRYCAKQVCDARRGDPTIQGLPRMPQLSLGVGHGGGMIGLSGSF
jgi:hypothetical protein